MSVLSSPTMDRSCWNASHDTPCGWIRVFCTPESTVLRLDLSGCSLLGLNLTSLSGLGGLKELDVSSYSDDNQPNMVWGLGDLTGLTWLDISGLDTINLLDVVTLRNLRYLVYMRKGATFPQTSTFPSLEWVRELVALSLAGSPLEGGIPEAVSNLTKLVSLDLSGSFLEGSVPNLEALKRLAHLSAANCFNLSGEVPTAPNLQYLHAAGNHFTKLTPSFFQTSALKEVNLPRNQLKAPLPAFNFPSLELLDLSTNGLISRIPSGLGNVTDVDLSWNRLYGSIPRGLVNLTHLDLSHNNLSGSIPPDIQVFGTLRNEGYLSRDSGRTERAGWVDLSGNELSGRIPAKLLYGAWTVNLSRNSLVGNIPEAPVEMFPVFVLRLVHWLDLSDNQLDGPLPSSFSTTPFRVLWLENNQFSGDFITTLRDITSHQREFPESLRVKGNRFIGDLTKLLDSDTRNSGVKVLDLSHNNFNMTPSEPFPNPLQTMLQRLCNSDLEELRLAASDLMGQPLPDRLKCSTSTIIDRLQRVTRHTTSLEFLQVLDLASCNLSGTLPETLFNEHMFNLTFLNVSNNRLSGAIPKRLPSTLRVLDLSNINVDEEIPAELFTGLPSLLHFNGSNNKLSGPIPQTFPLSLQVLDLSHNNLTGGIPGKLFFGLPNLRYIDLSSNNLSGPIPDGLPQALYSASFFANNPGLCGGPLRACSAPQPPQQGAVVIRVWLLVTIVVAVVLVCGGSCLLLVWRWRIYSKKHQQDADLIATLLERETVTVMPLRELRKATSNFSESAQIGVGGFGTVYSGNLADGTAVAIKKSKREGSSQYKQQFLNEVKIPSGVNHRHLVKLLGCSMENKIALLVFEFVPNGPLQEHLQRKRQGFSPLTWTQRLLIALQTSDALGYLHSAADPPIFHRDVKSSNILLDHGLNAKVADFGISKLAPSKSVTHVSTLAVQGTMGYIDPEYFATFQLTPRSDVYSFGVVLLELISAKPAIDFGGEFDEANLANRALSAMERGEWEELIDPVLADTYSLANGKASIDCVLALAVRCLASRSRERPQMKEVWQELQTVWLHWGSDASFPSDDHVCNYLQPQNSYCNVDAAHDWMSRKTPRASLCSSSNTFDPQIEMQCSSLIST